MFQSIEKGVRGGVSYIANRYGEANNKCVKEYDEKAPSKYIMYLDANNLYGWAMSQYLPTSGFRWFTEKEINSTDLSKYKEDSEKGVISEVDLEYPEELHDLHNDYPLASEKNESNKRDVILILRINKRTIQDQLIGQVHKLIPTHNKKESMCYIIEIYSYTPI